MIVRIAENAGSETFRQKSGFYLKGRFFALEQYKIRNVDWSNKFSNSIPEIKIVVSDTNENVRIFRCQNRRRYGGCSLCIYGQICAIRRFIESLGRNIRVMECPYIICGELLEDVKGNDITEKESPLLSFKKLVAKAILSNPIGLKSLLNQ